MELRINRKNKISANRPLFEYTKKLATIIAIGVRTK